MKRLLVSLAALFCLLMPATALAYNPLSSACNAGQKASASSACSVDAQNDPIGGTHGALKRVSLIIASIAGIAAVIIIIVAGFEYVTSAGDPQKAAGARSAIVGAAVGIFIIVAAESILLFVLSQL